MPRVARAGASEIAQKMLKMKVGPAKFMKTNGSKKWKPIGPGKFMKTNSLFCF
jgi:hypothetical protein